MLYYSPLNGNCFSGGQQFIPTYLHMYQNQNPLYSNICSTCSQSGEWCCDSPNRNCNCINGFCECTPWPKLFKVLTQDMVLESFTKHPTPLWKMGRFFEYYFPNQIAIAPHRINETVNVNFRNTTVKEIIDKLGLIRLSDNLIPRTECKKGREKYCCETFFILGDDTKPLKTHNYREYPEFAEAKCIVYALEDGANHYDYKEGDCSF